MFNKRIFSLALAVILLSSSIIMINYLQNDDLLFPIGTVSAFPGGNGTAESPYQITTLSELQSVRSNRGAHYVLMNDIDATKTQN